MFDIVQIRHIRARKNRKGFERLDTNKDAYYRIVVWVANVIREAFDDLEKMDNKVVLY